MDYQAWQLIVELDGRVAHDGIRRFRDMRRDNRFAFHDWLTLRYGWFDLTYRPCGVASRWPGCCSDGVGPA